MTPRAVTLIVNPAAGSLLDSGITPESIADRIAALGFEVELLTGPPDGLPGFIETALDRPAELVAVAGGDGTINTAAAALAGSDKILMPIPAGTLNHLSRDLGIPADIDGAVAAMRHGRPARVDVGEVDGHLFLCSSVIGFPSRIGGQREHWRGRLNPIRWIRVIAKNLSTLSRDGRLAIRLPDAGVAPFRSRHLMVAVGGYDEAPGRLFTRSRLDTGAFEVYAMPRPTPSGLLLTFLRALAGRWRRSPELKTAKAATVEVSSSRSKLRVMNDGELLLLEPPLTYSIRPAGLRVLRAAAETETDVPTAAA
ncbi:MAG: diacylglycerol kinase family protein [Thalassobaculum sp.]|uniref:diacylglycerol/lipid kinase family protein n=1 Tax=Thalassobaculum sp. TaxID=2022740 RepID=UPI0032EE05A4